MRNEAEMTSLVSLETQQESPDIYSAPPMPQAPRRRTPARIRTYFLRQFERSGSLVEAAARAGITPRTVQRWRGRDPRFALHYNTLIERQEAILADAAIQRAGRVQRRIYCFRGKEVASVERTNDQMLKFVLSRFDRERAERRRDFDAEVEKRAEERNRELHQVIAERGRDMDRKVKLQAEIMAEKIIQDRIKKMSPSMRQAFEAAGR
ncbi:hypothetical protein [Reyranella sp.]|uniref:hypothetical protein n=1 Tax=Reyranella sp. TaxID=1929291 RepID=UPI00272F27B9|nr:hypothetical protein [Reyranella sp.]